MHNFQEYLRSVYTQAVVLTFAGTAAVQGLIAIWAATGRVNWFIRALAVWGGVMLLVPIRLYEPAAVFAVASPLIVALIRGLNWLENRSQPRSVVLPMGPSDWWKAVVVAVLVSVGCETILQGYWWFDPMAFLAWCIILVAIVATIYDCIVTRGRVTWQWLLSLLHLASTSLRLATVSLNDQPGSCNTPGKEPPAKARFRFGLRDLFFLMLLVALVIVGIQIINQQYSGQEWLSFGILGTLLAVIVSLAYGCVVSRWRLVLAPLLAVAVAVTARVSPTIWGPFFDLKFICCFGRETSFWTGMRKVLLLETVYSELALLVIVILALFALSHASIIETPLRRLASGALAAVTLFGGLSLAWLYWQMFWLTPIPPAFATGTTHYEEIAAITRHADPRWFWGSPIPPVAGNTLRTLPVSGDVQALIAELSVLVGDDNFVPFRVHDKLFRKEDLDDFRRDHEHFYSFAQLIDNEAIRASTLGNYDRSADLALINIRIGTMLQRGGTEGYAEMGKYCECYGYQRLTHIRGNLSPETMRGVVAAIGHAAALPEDRAIGRARGQAFGERAIGWTERLTAIFHGWLNRPWSNTEVNTFNILLQTDLAIRLFQHERGKLPESLKDLVPSYLATVPLDPLAKSPQPLQYRIENGQFVLYSVNSFGQDNGGVFGNREHAMHSSMSDIDVETWIRP